MEVGVVPVTITSHDPHGEFVLPAFATLGNVHPEGLLPMGSLTENTTSVLLNFRLLLFPRLLSILVSGNQQARRGATILAGITDPNYQSEVGLLVHNAGREEDLGILMMH